MAGVYLTFRMLFVWFLLLALYACGGGGGARDPAPVVQESSPPKVSAPALPISAPSYSLLGAIFNGGGVVESQYYPNASSYGLFFGCADERTCFISDFAATPDSTVAVRAVPNTCRFPYAFQDHGAHYLACVDTTFDWNVYLWKSTDLKTWQIQNNAQPILRRAPGTQWANIWNVAILPVNGRWHMLAETSPTPDRMDIAYAWADPSVSLDFTPNQGPVVIPNGGNPELHLKNGKMLALHGLYHDRSPTDPWYTTYSTADPSSPLLWTIHRDKLLIQQAGIDVCDPTYIEVGGQARIAVSYDQNKVVELAGPAINP